MNEALPKEMDTVCRMAILKYGEIPQCKKAVEELFELVIAISNYCEGYLQGGRRKDAVIDEVADVFIMNYQLMIMLGGKEVIERIQFKLDRLQKKMGAK